MARTARRMAHIVRRMARTARVMADRNSDLTFYPLLPTLYRVKVSQPELCVGLDGRMTRVARHWAAVDDLLPAAHPLVLLADETRERFQELAQELPLLQNALLGAAVDLKLAWGVYERHKRGMNVWLRASYQGTDVFAARRRVPGGGQSFDHWWKAAQGALLLWRNIETDPPPMPPGYDPGTPLRRTLAEFEGAVGAFNGAWWVLRAAEVEWKIARGKLGLAQDRATEMLMAYGHGARARLGNKGALLISSPRLWPERVARNTGRSAA